MPEGRMRVSPRQQSASITLNGRQALSLSLQNKKRSRTEVPGAFHDEDVITHLPLDHRFLLFRVLLCPLGQFHQSVDLAS